MTVNAIMCCGQPSVEGGVLHYSNIVLHHPWLAQLDYKQAAWYQLEHSCRPELNGFRADQAQAVFGKLGGKQGRRGGRGWRGRTSGGSGSSDSPGTWGAAWSSRPSRGRGCVAWGRAAEPPPRRPGRLGHQQPACPRHCKQVCRGRGREREEREIESRVVPSSHVRAHCLASGRLTWPERHALAYG